MSGADRARAAAARAVTAARPSGKGTIKRVRSSLDLTLADHHALNLWSAEASSELGEVSVTRQGVLEALVRRLLTDETLARKIRSDLAGPR